MATDERITQVTIEADTMDVASAICAGMYWTPGAMREVESCIAGVRAWLCFLREADAALWDRTI